MCLAYFFELFTVAPKSNLLERPSFFIVSSTFFYAVIPIPFFLTAIDIYTVEKSVSSYLTACHYILLTIMLFAMVKAFLKKIPIST